MVALVSGFFFSIGGQGVDGSCAYPAEGSNGGLIARSYLFHADGLILRSRKKKAMTMFPEVLSSERNDIDNNRVSAFYGKF